MKADGLAEGGSWHEVTTLQGSKTGKTQTFPVKGRKFRLKWSFKGNPSLSPTFFLFGFQVYQKDEGQLYMASLQRGSLPDTSGVEVVEDGPGEYYLMVVSEKLQSWTVAVEDFY